MSTTHMSKPQDKDVPAKPTGESRPPQFSTLSVHGGEDRQKPGDSITDPIFCASTYTFADTQAVIDFIEAEAAARRIWPLRQPGRTRRRAKAGGARRGRDRRVLFSSGMAAIVGLLMAKLNAGDEVIFFDECYHRSREFCTKHLSRFGVKTRQVPACDYDAMEAAITPRTKLLVSESPTNPHLSVVDLDRFADIGRRPWRRNADRCHAGHAVQPAAARGRHRLRAALGHQVPGRPQRSAGRRD